MPYQIGITILTRIKPEEIEVLKQLLREMNDDVVNNSVIPFSKLSRTHFARFAVLDTFIDPDGLVSPAQLLFMTDSDGPPGRHLKEVVNVAGEGMDKIYCHCEDYPPSGARTPEKRLAYLRSKMIKANTYYVNTIGRSLQQIRRGAQLRKILQDFLDCSQKDWSRMSALQIRAAIQEHIKSQPELRWAKKPAERPGLFFRLRETLHLVGLLLLGLILSPILVVLLLVWLVLLRFHELTDPVSQVKLDPARLRTLDNLEDFVVQNQITTVDDIKPGRFWRITALSLLWFGNNLSRHFYNRGSLAGLKTVHFARLFTINNNRQVVFASYYDGSLESYMDDFVDKIAWVLNTVFSNERSYPKTRWMIFGGAQTEQGFKHFLRGHQIQTQVWYSAYDNLTAVNLENNAKLFAGLFGDMHVSQAEEWLRLL